VLVEHRIFGCGIQSISSQPTPVQAVTDQTPGECELLQQFG